LYNFKIFRSKAINVHAFSIIHNSNNTETEKNEFDGLLFDAYLNFKGMIKLSLIHV